MALDIATLGRKNDTVIFSCQNELYSKIEAVGSRAICLDTFDSGVGVVFRLPRLISIRRAIGSTVKSSSITRVVNLMPHVWSPFLSSAVKRAGSQYIVIVHDAAPHPGDPTALVHRWLMRDGLKADIVVTLSEHVSRELGKRYPALRGRLRTLFLPLTGVTLPQTELSLGHKQKFLFFGRIMQYKGPALFTEACEILRREDVPFEASIVGEGDLGGLRPRLEAAGVNIVNRWIADDAVPGIMSGHDTIVVSSIEASQSGVVATAFAAGLPVIVTPVGGLIEQVRDGSNGLIAKAVSAHALAEQMRRLAESRELYETLVSGVREARENLTMGRFLSALDAL